MIKYKLLKREEFIALLPQFYELYRLSFNHEINKQYLRWRYMENPMEDYFVGAALDNGAVVAGAAWSPCLMYLDGIIRKALISINSMVHPDYQRGGIFVKLHELFDGSFIEDGYEFLISFPNHLSHRTTITRLGRTDIYEIPTMTLNLERKSVQGPVDCHTDDQFSLDYSEICPFPNLNRIVKNSSYLRWRYYRDPINQYRNFVLHKKNKVSSYMVVKQYLDRLNIIDFQPGSYEEGSYLLDCAICYAQTLNLRMVTTWAPRHTFYHSLAERKGFRNNIPITYFCAKNFNDRMAVSMDYSDWYIQQGDFYAY